MGLTNLPRPRARANTEDDAALIPIQKCAEWARGIDLDPVGTVGSYQGFMLVEWPLPWPSDLAMVPELLGITPELEAANCRLQAIVPSTQRNTTSLTYYRRSLYDWFAGFGRSELVVDRIDVASGIRALLESPDLPADRNTSTDTPIDLLVCTHGRRDRCCGSLGTSLIRELDQRELAGKIRLHRTSHTGGHRFAPTALVLPEGTGWAYLDSDVVEAITRRSGFDPNLLKHYRGCSGLDSPPIQALERSVFARLGWGLLGEPRRGVEAGDGVVQLHVGRERPQVWEGHVTSKPVLAMPKCGTPSEGAAKHTAELIVSDVRLISDE